VLRNSAFQRKLRESQALGSSEIYDLRAGGWRAAAVAAAAAEEAQRIADQLHESQNETATGRVPPKGSPVSGAGSLFAAGSREISREWSRQTVDEIRVDLIVGCRS
jgi:hypothetical protein